MQKSTRGKALGFGLAAMVTLGAVALQAQPSRAALLWGTPHNDVLIGRDDDVKENAAIHPEGTMADQSLSKADVLFGMEGDDLLIGLLGSDYLDGGPGDDVLLGGTEQGTAPNSDIQVGGDGNDVSVWAGGDGSEAFVGGDGIDAIVFSTIDRDGANVPTVQMVDLGWGPRPINTSNLTGAPGFCKIDPAPHDSGYDWLVRFIRRTDNVLLVTVRVQNVEQVFCASQAGGGAEWANLAGYAAGDLLRPITLDRIKQVNPLVGAMVR
jgi:Ca2+-binding RTX toxin-like protein